MKHGLSILFALAVGIAGCGGNTPPAGTADGCESHPKDEHGEHGEVKHDFANPVSDFHAILSPIWHSPEGADRQAKACAQAQAMHDKAVAVEAAPPPEGAKPEDYKAAAKELIAASDRVAEICKKGATPEVETQLAPLHDAFHKVAELGKPKGEPPHEHKDEHPH